MPAMANALCGRLDRSQSHHYLHRLSLCAAYHLFQIGPLVRLEILCSLHRNVYIDAVASASPNLGIEADGYRKALAP